MYFHVWNVVQPKWNYNFSTISFRAYSAEKGTSVHYQKLLQNFSQNFSNSFCEVEKVIFYEKSIIKYIFWYGVMMYAWECVR